MHFLQRGPLANAMWKKFKGKKSYYRWAQEMHELFWPETRKQGLYFRKKLQQMRWKASHGAVWQERNKIRKLNRSRNIQLHSIRSRAIQLHSHRKRRNNNNSMLKYLWEYPTEDSNSLRDRPGWPRNQDNPIRR